MERMKVCDLYQKYSFNEIFPHLKNLFEVNSGHRYAESAIGRWRALYDYWAVSAMTGRGITSSFHIRLVSRWEHCSPWVDMNCAVYDRQGQPECPLAAYEVDDVLAMEVEIDDDVDISEQEFIAGLFWEMSYIKTEKKLEILKK